MKVILSLLMILSIGTLVGCSNEKEVEINDTPNYEINEEYKDTAKIRVDGKNYISNGKISKDERAWYMDGVIASTVEFGGEPKRNNESNFGSNYSYQYTTPYTIDVLVDNSWVTFESEEIRGNSDIIVDAWSMGIYPEDISSKGMTLRIKKQDGGLQKGELFTEDVFYVTKMENGKPIVIGKDLGEPDWEHNTYRIPNEGEIEITLDWSEIYGELEKGTYRVYKPIYDWNNGNYECVSYYKDFEI